MRPDPVQPGSVSPFPQAQGSTLDADRGPAFLRENEGKHNSGNGHEDSGFVGIAIGFVVRNRQIVEHSEEAVMAGMKNHSRPYAAGSHPKPGGKKTGARDGNRETTHGE